MDIKLKNYRYSSWLKLFAIVLCVAGMLTLAYGLLKAPYFEVAVQNTDFKESMICENILRDTYNQVADIAFNYKNDEYIKSGSAINGDDIDQRKEQLISIREDKIRDIKNRYNNIIEEIEVENSNIDNSTGSAPTTPGNESNQRSNTLVQERDEEIQEAIKTYNDEIKTIKSDYIDDQLNEYHNKVENLKKSTGVYYTVVENGKVTFSNIDDNATVEEFYKELPLSQNITQSNAYSINSSYSYSYSTSSESYPNNHTYTYTAPSFPNNAIVYLGMSQEKYNTELATFNENSKEGLLGIKISSIGLLAFLIGLIYIIYASGRRVDKEGINLILIDYVYLDVTLLITVGAIALCMTAFLNFIEYFFRDRNYLNNDLLLVVLGVIISIGTLIGILYVTMFTKRLKKHEVIAHTLVFKVCSWIILKIKSIYTNLFLKIKSISEKSPLAKRLILIFGAYAVITVFCISLFFVGPIGLLGLLVIVGVNLVVVNFLLKGLKNLNDIKDGAERIRSGELSYNIPEQGIPEFRELAETINKIADGLKTAVSSQVKSERMKSELITNVSHDLKTPLTSIITYVDLLKTEGLKSENADKYLGIIDAKSQRLKALTEDLFEAAKATSGSISVNIERLDVVALINQGLGELSDKIEASGLSFKTNFQSEKLYVNADGKLLWRVIENLLSNVFKYAMPNSRVYIDAAATAKHVSLIIKNISAYELNVNENELMERFKRGDASRHSEGSGLGLSIAKSLTELQGGSFHIDIDGDLFKATIVLVGCE
ncbi:MAG: HAMP domain-containing sensor histidine kinase [Ruminiclostridium sp.]